MKYRRATANDLPKVFEHLADRFAQEYVIARRFQHDPQCDVPEAIRKTKSSFRKAISNGTADTILDNGKPVAILLWEIKNDTEAHTGFAATEEFFSRSHLRFLRGHVRDVQVRLGNLPLVSANWSGRVDVQKWFELLNFKFHMHHGPAKVFVLWPPQSASHYS